MTHFNPKSAFLGLRTQEVPRTTRGHGNLAIPGCIKFCAIHYFSNVTTAESPKNVPASTPVEPYQLSALLIPSDFIAR